MAAAISAARRRASVVICEKMPRLGKKVLASGNGRCNLTNDILDESFYNSASRRLVSSVLSRFGGASIKDFFSGLGLKLYSDGGRVFPVTNQSSSVVSVLELELKRLSVPVEKGFCVESVKSAGDGFIVTSGSGRALASRRVILSCGGRSYPALGSDGGAYAIAGSFGHSLIEPVPAAVALAVKDPMCQALQGQKITSAVRAVSGGRTVRSAKGDLLFTKYGLSGTAIMDISDEISVDMNRSGRKDVFVSADLVPFMEEAALADEIAGRMRMASHPEDIVAGILPNKFAGPLKDLLKSGDAGKIAAALKARRFNVLGTRGWNEAEFTAGGVDTAEVDEITLESKKREGVYFSGEMLDVNGARGGYNLAWAWASGFIAGEAAANA